MDQTHPPVVIEKAERLEQLLQQVEQDKPWLPHRCVGTRWEQILQRLLPVLCGGDRVYQLRLFED